eukprot:1160307-Pyramimonas_sp.AAC.3
MYTAIADLIRQLTIISPILVSSPLAHHNLAHRSLGGRCEEDVHPPHNANPETTDASCVEPLRRATLARRPHLAAAGALLLELEPLLAERGVDPAFQPR